MLTFCLRRQMGARGKYAYINAYNMHAYAYIRTCSLSKKKNFITQRKIKNTSKNALTSNILWATKYGKHLVKTVLLYRVCHIFGNASKNY